VATPIEKKSQVVDVVRNTVARLKLQSGKKLKGVRTDQISEYVNGEMAAYFGEKGIFHQTTTRYFPEQNGVVERLNWVLMKRARAMLIELGLPDEMWAKAVVMANYIRNRTPVSAHGKTPWEAFYEKKPDVSHMRIFGARAFMHMPGALRHILEPVSVKG
jgi:transposase InsO family protein